MTFYDFENERTTVPKRLNSWKNEFSQMTQDRVRSCPPSALSR